MTSKADKEKLKLIQDRCQTYLTDLLKDEDNKYCVDCDAKGPRWASWNLGVFLCIRCAGIHRNLGVHISKVKSVNLDAWTPEQIAHLQQMGNSKARAVYEANLPDNFRRPQTDSTLEAFIRSKYEQRKYIAKEWSAPPTPPPAFDIEEERKKEKECKKQKNRSAILNKGSGSGSPSSELQTNSVPRPHSNPAGTTISADKVPKDVAKNSVTGSSKSSSDLLGLGLDFSSPTSDHPVTSTPALQEDPFSAFVSASNSTNTSSAKPVSLADEESDFFNQKVPDKKMDKDSILKMFDNSNNFMTATQAATFPGNNPISANLFAPSAAAAHPNNLLQQNGSGPHVSNQATIMNQTTNPFLASAASGASVPTASMSLFSDMRSLNLGPTVPANNWMSAGVPHSVPVVPQPASAFDSINPFTTGAGAPVPPAPSQPLFADFSQPVRNQTEAPALNWGLPAANPIQATSTLPSSDLWQ